MKRAIAAACAVLAAVAAFAGAQAETSSKADKGKVRLKVLNNVDNSLANAAKEADLIWDGFAAEYPDIEIEREDLFNEPFHQKTMAYIAAGQLPDVVLMWPSGRSSELHKNKLVKDLTPFLKADGLMDKFAPAAVAPQMSGYLAMLPMGITYTHMFYVNADLLKELGLAEPKTYDDLKKMVPVLKAKGLETVLIPAQDAWVMQSCLFSMIVGRMAGDAFLDDVRAGKAKFTDKPFVDSLRVVDALYRDGIISQKALQMPYGEAPNLFASGRAPFLIDGDWRTQAFQTDASTGAALIPPAKQNGIKLTVFPELPGEKFHKTSSSVLGTGFGMNASIPAGSDREKAAWTLIKYLQSEKVQKIRLESGSSFPSRKGIASINLEPLGNARAAFYGDYSGTYVLDAVFEARVYEPINVGLQEIAMGSTTPESVAQKAQAAFDAWKAEQK